MKKKGYKKNWIDKRMHRISVRQSLTIGASIKNIFYHHLQYLYICIDRFLFFYLFFQQNHYTWCIRIKEIMLDTYILFS